MKKIVVAGSGGHCKVILDLLLEKNEYEIIGLISKDCTNNILGIPVIGDDSYLEALHSETGVECGFVAIGNNSVRERVYRMMEKIGFEMISIISPHAVVSRFAEIGPGSVVMSGCIVNACAKIGEGCILNTNSSIDHECIVGDFSHIAPGCSISGTTEIGRNCFLGTGARVIDKIKIGDNTIVGAGACVVRNIEGNCTIVGVPANRILKEN